MKFTVERDPFADAVAWTARGLPSRPSVPVLAGALLVAEENRLTVSGFDFEVSTRVGINADVETAGRTLVSGRLLAEITRALPSAPVVLEVSGARAQLTCGSARFTLPTLPVEDYPTLPEMPAVAGTVPGDAFAGAVAQVAVAAGRDDTLPTMTGVRVEIDGDRIVMAATDRYRLAARELSWQPGSSGMSAVALVPARTLTETAKAMSSAEEITVALAGTGAGESLIGFSGAGRQTTTRLLEGQFPPYQSLWPKETATVAHVQVAPLVEAVRRVSLVAERSTPVRLRFSDGEVVLEAGGSDEAQASEALEAGLEGEGLTIAFNPSFLLDGLGALGSDTARFAFTAATKPAVLSGKDGGSDYRYLLMPVRLSG